MGVIAEEVLAVPDGEGVDQDIPNGVKGCGGGKGAEGIVELDRRLKYTFKSEGIGDDQHLKISGKLLFYKAGKNLC